MTIKFSQIFLNFNLILNSFCLIPECWRGWERKWKGEEEKERAHLKIDVLTQNITSPYQLCIAWVTVFSSISGWTKSFWLFFFPTSLSWFLISSKHNSLTLCFAVRPLEFIRGFSSRKHFWMSSVPPLCSQSSANYQHFPSPHTGFWLVKFWVSLGMESPQRKTTMALDHTYCEKKFPTL